MRVPRFRIATILTIILIVALAPGWWKDHHDLQQRIKDGNRAVVLQGGDYKTMSAVREYNWAFKTHMWTAADYLLTDTGTLESQLAAHLNRPAGRRVGYEKERPLRVPSAGTYQQVVALLEHDDPNVRLAAARLLALYGESLQFATKSESEDVRAMHERATQPLLNLLGDSDVSARGAAALALGHVNGGLDVLAPLMQTFRNEQDGNVRIHIAWAIERLLNSRQAPGDVD